MDNTGMNKIVNRMNLNGHEFNYSGKVKFTCVKCGDKTEILNDDCICPSCFFGL